MGKSGVVGAVLSPRVRGYLEGYADALRDMQHARNALMAKVQRDGEPCPYSPVTAACEFGEECLPDARECCSQEEWEKDQGWGDVDDAGEPDEGEVPDARALPRGGVKEQQ